MSEYSDYITDLLSDWGPSEAKSMFGGHGIFRSGLMFALIADDMLYLKADAQTVPLFEEEGSEPFIYEGQKKPITLSYWLAPEAFFEEGEDTILWADRAFKAALRADAKKTKKKRK